MASRTNVIPLIALRFLLSKASDHFLSFIAWVSVMGVGLGVLALTTVTSVINGFEGELAKAITGIQGDVLLYSRTPIELNDEVRDKIRRIGGQVKGLSESFLIELMVSGPNGVAGAVLDGIDPKTIGHVTEIPNRIVSGSMPTDVLPGARKEVVLGDAIAERIGAKTGDVVRIILPFVGEGIDAPDSELRPSKVVEATVVGIVKVGMYHYDSKMVFSTIGTVQELAQEPDKGTTFKLKLAPGADSEKVARDLSDQFGYPFRAKDWGQLHKNLFYAIRIEKRVIAVLLTAIVVVAAFNVVSTLMMMIHDKTKEIAILKAMGFRPAQSFRLFCYIGMAIGTVGIGLGVLLGLGANALIANTDLVRLPADVYNIGFLPVVLRWSEVGIICAAALGICFLATLYPALRVSWRKPLEGLRHD
ncbi:MAG: FtsX-like permease family protein [Bacteriovoracia bacterium]